MKSLDWVTIGVVVGPHGTSGEVRVKPLTDFPERFLTTERLFGRAQNGDRTEFQVERARAHTRGLVILKLEGITDRGSAEGLRYMELQVPRDEAVPLPKGTYYVFDLLRCDVFTTDGKNLGHVVDVIQTGANDVYHVRGADNQEVLIPAIKDVVKEIDVEAGRIVVELPDGLMDLT